MNSQRELKIASRMGLALCKGAEKTTEQVGELYDTFQRFAGIRVEDVDAAVVLVRYKPKKDVVSPDTLVGIMLGGAHGDLLNTDYAYLGVKETLEALLQNALLELIDCDEPQQRKL